MSFTGTPQKEVGNRRIGTLLMAIGNRAGKATAAVPAHRPTSVARGEGLPASAAPR